MSSEAALERVAAGAKGKLVDVVQVYGDCLWQDLGKRAVPNEGFWANAVVPLGFDASAGIMQDLDPADAHGMGAAEEAGGSSGGGEGEGGAGPSGVAGAALQELHLGGDQGSATSSGAVAPAVAPPPTAAAEAGPGGGSSSGAAAASDVDMEALLQACLLQALHVSVADTDLPLAGSILWAQHMLHVRPPGTMLDIKKSKHKKMSKFLQVTGFLAGSSFFQSLKRTQGGHGSYLAGACAWVGSVRPYYGRSMCMGGLCEALVWQEHVHGWGA